jgi:hypothetical protein
VREIKALLKSPQGGILSVHRLGNVNLERLAEPRQRLNLSHLEAGQSLQAGKKSLLGRQLIRLAGAGCRKNDQ